MFNKNGFNRNLRGRKKTVQWPIHNRNLRGRKKAEKSLLPITQ